MGHVHRRSQDQHGNAKRPSGIGQAPPPPVPPHIGLPKALSLNLLFCGNCNRIAQGIEDTYPPDWVAASGKLQSSTLPDSML